MRHLVLLVLVLAACREDARQAIDPVALSSESVGHYCQMTLLEHPGPKAQVHLQGLPGAPLFFSQVRDAIAYARLPEQSHPILATWVNDMGAPGATWEDPGATNWIAAEAAQYVVGAAVEGGMGAPELVPFASVDAAHAFAGVHGGTVMALDRIPDSAVSAPVGSDGQAAGAGASDYAARLRALSRKSGG
ncbi:MAG: nitrous oxide reductase accessory protein NosL, partial [Mangrovicoccus sp.]|jgi:copper chaperone NosL|nr:nitrous oxide reductase accessory protein NosL [Mangrovicoccus sp.]